VYIIVSPGFAVAGSMLGRLSVLVAVRIGADGVSRAGEAIDRANAELAAGATEASTRPLDAIEDEAIDELGDTESADAISIIKQLRQRMNATE
jgi:hypothetical protein